LRGLRGAEMLPRDQFCASAWRLALKAAGLAEDRFRFHACRHWCASTLLAEGAPITAVAGHLGDTVRVDAARRGRPDHGSRRPSRRHGGDGEPHVRPLAARRPGRTRRRARPGARSTWRAI